MARVRSPRPLWVCLLASMSVAACGGVGSASSQQSVVPAPAPPPANPDFTLTLSVNSVSVAQGSTSSPVSVIVTPAQGFSGTVQVALTGLPSGVSSSPTSPFPVTASAPQNVVFGADPTAATGTIGLIAKGVSGALTHSANLSLDVQATAPPPVGLPRTAFVRTDAVPSLDDPIGEPRRRRIALDAARSHIFVANAGMNRLDLFLTSDASSLGAIAIPAVTSADITADGGSVWAGTSIEQIVTVDATSLSIIQRYPVVGVPGPLPTIIFNRPVEVLTLTGGKALVRLRRPDAPISLLALWDPSAGSFTDLTSKAPSVFQNGAGVIARTGDHTRFLAAANDASGNLAVIDAGGKLLTGPATLGSGTVPLVAANPDGTHFAALLSNSGGSTIFLLDSSLQATQQYSVASAHGMAFAPDGSTLYVSINDDLPPLITALDGHDLHLIGQFPDVRFAGARSEIEAADATGLLFGIANRGVSFLDAATPASLPVNPPVLAPTAAVTPAEGPPAGGTTISLAGQSFVAGVQVAFAATPASSSNYGSATQVQATSPPHSAGGLVNVTAFFPGGWLALAPDAFSFGPQILKVLPNTGKKDGGDFIQILGHGFGTDPSQLTVTIGGSAATVQKVENVSAIAASLGLDPAYPFPIQRITLQAPEGTPGSADITVTSPAGTTTAPRAFQFLQDVQVHAKPGFYKFILFDSSRQRLYLTNIDHLEVFDLSSAAFLPGGLIPPGGPPPNGALRGMALTPDASQLAVADFGAQNVYVLKPDTPGTGATVSVGGVAGLLNSGPVRVAATSTGQLFVSFAAAGPNACTTCLGQLNIAAQTIQVAPQAVVSNLTGAPLVTGTSSGNQVFLAFGSSPGGPVAAWDANSNTFVASSGNSSVDDLSAAADGNMFALRSKGYAQIRDASLTLTAVPAAVELESLPGWALVPGITLHRTGALLYQPFLASPLVGAPAVGGVDISDTHSGALRLRVFLPEPLLTDVDALHGSFLAIDDTGQQIFALTASGLTIVKLAEVPLGIGSLTPSQGLAAGGAQITLRGSGMVAGTTVTLGGKPAAATFVDANTLHIVAPALSPGPHTLVLSNPDGESVSLDAAYVTN